MEIRQLMYYIEEVRTYRLSSVVYISTVGSIHSSFLHLLQWQVLARPHFGIVYNPSYPLFSTSQGSISSNDISKLCRNQATYLPLSANPSCFPIVAKFSPFSSPPSPHRRVKFSLQSHSPLHLRLPIYRLTLSSLIWSHLTQFAATYFISHTLMNSLACHDTPIII